MSHYRLNLFIQPEHAKRLDELATKKGVSKSSIVAAALASWLSPDAADQREAGIAKRLNDLAGRARNRQLKPEEIQGGTFTITNPGIFGTVIGFPIINQPQVAILGVGGVEMRPAVVTDEFGGHAIVARRRGYISLGYDHRLVNGADADQFLARVKQILEGFPDEA